MEFQVGEGPEATEAHRIHTGGRVSVEQTKTELISIWNRKGKLVRL